MSAFPAADWERLRELRAEFLAAEARPRGSASVDYFRSARDVELYDATFARRIEWKWAAALRELELRARELAPKTMVDWACGSGAASRAVLTSPLGARIERVTLFERSRLAREHARRTLLELRPGLDVRIASSSAECSAELAVASHVLDELDTAGEAALERALRASDVGIVLESGARPSSRRLGELRARLVRSPRDESVGPSHENAASGERANAAVSLTASAPTSPREEPASAPQRPAGPLHRTADPREQSADAREPSAHEREPFADAPQRPAAALQRAAHEFEVLAPCTHREACGALADPEQWCHLFARPPAQVFQDAFWAEFSRELGVDLRSLSYSFVAFARSTTPVAGAASAPSALHRILGRPRLLKGRALLDACSLDGFATLTLLEREDRQLFKSLEHASNEPRLWSLERDGARIRSPRPAFL